MPNQDFSDFILLDIKNYNFYKPASLLITYLN